MQNARPILQQELIKMDDREFIGQSSVKDNVFFTYWKVGNRTYSVKQFFTVEDRDPTDNYCYEG
jgi:hypothetical protein